MNSRSYGVIKNIQDAKYGGRKVFADLLTPDFGMVCKSLSMRHTKISNVANAGPAMRAAVSDGGPVMIEIDMAAIGDFARSFAGPPVRAVTEKA